MLLQSSLGTQMGFPCSSTGNFLLDRLHKLKAWSRRKLLCFKREEVICLISLCRRKRRILRKLIRNTVTQISTQNPILTPCTFLKKCILSFFLVLDIKLLSYIIYWYFRQYNNNCHSMFVLQRNWMPLRRICACEEYPNISKPK